VPTTSLNVDRAVVAAVVVLAAMAFLPAAVDPVNVPKLTVLCLGAVALVVVAVYRAVRYRLVQLPWGAAAASALVVLAGLVAATVVSPTTAPAWYGAYGRNSGLLAYACALVVFFAVLRSCSAPGGVRWVAIGVGVSGLLVASYGMLQKLGVDAVPWNNPFNPIISALGNPDFASAYMGVVVPVAAGGALWRGWSVPWRVASGLTAALCLVTALLSSAAQGPLAAGTGLAVLACGVLLDRRSTVRLVGLTVLGAATAASAAVVLLGAVARSGPLSPLFTGISYDARTYYWGAAVQMLRDHPLFGVGMEQYGGFWRTARSDQAVAQLGGASYTDSAHSVPLQMFAQGGLVLGLTYVGFVVVVGWALVRGLRRLAGQERLLLAALGGAWAAYHVQSAVSIDQVPLLLLHFVLAAAVVTAAGAVRLREVRLPGALVPVVPHRNDVKSRRRAAQAPVVRNLEGADLAMLGVLGVLALYLTWLSFGPLRASVAVKDGDEVLRTGDGNAAFEHYDRATGLVPGLTFAWVKKAELFATVQPPQTQLAKENYLKAAARDPRDPNTRRAAATHAETLGDLDLARSLHEAAVDLDPLNVDTLVSAADFHLRHAGAERARVLMEDVIPRLDRVARLPAHAPLWAALGDARAVLGDVSGARTAYGVAMALQPDQATAKKGLAALPAA
jgi:putative inorganic carbon (HCO3(-)) transporter